MEEEGFIELRLAARKLKSPQHEIVSLLRGSGRRVYLDCSALKLVSGMCVWMGTLIIGGVERLASAMPPLGVLSNSGMEQL